MIFRYNPEGVLILWNFSFVTPKVGRSGGFLVNALDVV